MNALIPKIIKNNFFISTLLHVLFVSLSGLSFLFVSASSASIVDVPLPIHITFIGAPAGTDTSTPGTSTPNQGENQKKEPETITPPTKISPPPPLPKKKIHSPEVKKVEPSQKVETPPGEQSTGNEGMTEKNISESVSKSAGQGSGQGSHGGITYEQALLKLLSNAKRYPERARRRGISGDGQIHLSLHRSGSIKNISVNSSTGHQILDKELIKMVHRAAPLPAIPSSYEITEFIIPVSFSLIE